ncbi:MAG: hypothetical protein A2341_24200 [Deltaproteobacteria bacterium RIFOXYB12_FULL_58_9]|nr:MAG: hypothetical protein A2341_24200 [Deltaproteobacteria bacterium RIFOXYB12_FULL_58_9]
MRPDAATLGAAKESAIDKTHKKKQTESNKVLDSFQRVAPQLAKLAGKKMGGIQFTNEHLAQVAMAFAGLLRKNPNAQRRERARMFAKAFLTSRKFGQIFDQADESELESIYDQIGDQLDGSPVLAQLVDEVTEGARKINLG